MISQMNSSMENSTMDLREIDVLRFFFELNQQQMDPAKLQQILLQHQIQNQLRNSTIAHQLPAPPPPTIFSPIFKPKKSNISTPSVPTRITNISQIPEPKIVFQYVPSPKFPTPTSTPEPKSSSEDEIEDYEKAERKTKNFLFKDRCHFINLKEEQNRKLLMTPTSSVHESDHSDHEIESNLPKLKLSSKSSSWCGSSIYTNIPDIVMSEYDKILRESHNIKKDVIDQLNHAFPVNYEYNPKKSRIRTNYSDPQVADDRTRNNIASRRSRQRKKFLTHIHQYSLDFDDDENFLLKKQEKWLRAMIGNLENKILSNTPERTEELFKLRSQCGFE